MKSKGGLIFRRFRIRYASFSSKFSNSSSITSPSVWETWPGNAIPY
jgi:hypothetical protein